MGSKKEETNKKQNQLKWILLYGFLIIYMGAIMGTLSFGMISSLKVIRTRTSIFKFVFLGIGSIIFNTICYIVYEHLLFF